MRVRLDRVGPAVVLPRSAAGRAPIGVVAEGQPAALRPVDHPQQGDVRQARVGVAASDVAVHPAGPHLLDLLAGGVRGGLPDGRPGRRPLLVDRQCPVGGVDDAARPGVVEAPPPVDRLGGADPRGRDADRTDRVPDPDEADAGRVAVRRRNSSDSGRPVRERQGAYAAPSRPACSRRRMPQVRMRPTVLRAVQAPRLEPKKKRSSPGSWWSTIQR